MGLVDPSKPIEVRIFGFKHPAFSGLSDDIVKPDLWMDAKFSENGLIDLYIDGSGYYLEHDNGKVLCCGKYIGVVRNKEKSHKPAVDWGKSLEIKTNNKWGSRCHLCRIRCFGWADTILLYPELTPNEGINQVQCIGGKMFFANQNGELLDSSMTPIGKIRNKDTTRVLKDPARGSRFEHGSLNYVGDLYYFYMDMEWLHEQIGQLFNSFTFTVRISRNLYKEIREDQVKKGFRKQEDPEQSVFFYQCFRVEVVNDTEEKTEHSSLQHRESTPLGRWGHVSPWWHSSFDNKTKKTPDLSDIEKLVKFVAKMGITDPEYIAEPPLGLTPKTIWQTMRKEQILEAMKRYAKEGKTIPKAWIEELEELN